MRTPTPKQVALLAYLNLPIPSTISDASEAISAATENPLYHPALERWKKERLKLHPDIYAAEIANFKNGRSVELLDFNNGNRGLGEPLRKLTLPQVEFVVRVLDENCPGWDDEFRDEMGILNHDLFYEGFVPAAASLIPGIVKRGYEGEVQKVPSFRTLSTSSLVSSDCDFSDLNDASDLMSTGKERKPFDWNKLPVWFTVCMLIAVIMILAGVWLK